MKIREIIEQSIKVKRSISENDETIRCIDRAVDMIVDTYSQGGKVLFCGNGGSAADAQHLAAELSGRFYYDRPPLAAEALHVNTSYLTAVANDYSFDMVFARMVEAVGRKNDVLVGLSTSGRSSNVLKAFEQAKQKGMKVIAFTGSDTDCVAGVSDCILSVPSTDTPRIQEAHIMIGHIICQLVEERIFPKK